MKVVACTWMLFSMCLLGHRLIVYGEADEGQVLNNFLDSRLSRKPSPVMRLPAPFDVDTDSIQPQDGSMEADKISALPGQPDGVDFNLYSGYVTVDSKADRALFYYFAESPENSSTNPLVLWFNGGPACSSLIGAMAELGPFRVNNDGKTLSRNNYAWNNGQLPFNRDERTLHRIPGRSRLFVFKYDLGLSSMGDKSTAKDAYRFLINWLERFPQYKTRNLYFAGESYAGHYVGNGWIDDRTDYLGRYDYLWTHALNSDETNKGIHTYCHYFNDTDPEQCAKFINKSRIERGKIDWYNIYAPRCQLNSSSSDSINGFDPCSNHFISSYLNRADVQTALHAKVSAWDICNLKMYRGWTDKATTILPIIKNLMANGIRIWLYSGDLDSIVPVTSTRYAINKLKLPIKTAWRPWSTDEEVGGYVVEYDSLTFVTVRGAGRLVPSYQPARALAMISSFLGGALPPPVLIQNKNRR
ncbi:Serine carboxypeptidase-like 40, putative isoform 2 [Hibiscus syriacus]|uniref:Serine carboxypeptidase-like 40, putative isoform 2 n=1 Tax=Hibiscus syriacus TaxID=106335 RepID=A0A6A2YDN1_HIBSY|nr:Serine carboxypeptidase-like 40, putative isoform 2 [Hibiscus syriacus]